GLGSSPPLPRATWSTPTPWWRAIASRAAPQVGLGYRRRSSSTAARTASRTLGEGGQGASLVLSLTQPAPSAGCWPGTYGSKSRSERFRKLFDIKAPRPRRRGAPPARSTPAPAGG